MGELLKINDNESIYLENNIDAISSPQKQILAIHGLGTYHGWYDELAKTASKGNIAVYYPDLPGFGQSQSLGSGKINSYKSWYDAIKTVWAKMHEDNPNADSYILGHSMGGLLVLSIAHELTPCPKGIITTVPAVLSHPKAYSITKFIIPTFFKALFRPHDHVSLSNPSELKDKVSKNKHTDIHLTDKVTARLFFQILRLMIKAWGNLIFNRHDIPTYALAAGKDKTVSTPAIKLFFSLYPKTNLEFKILEELKHDLFILPEAPHIIDNILTWLNDISDKNNS